MRKLLFNLHLYLALAIGLFVVIVGVTGSIMAFEGEIDHATNPGLYKVEPVGQPLNAAGLLAAVQKAYPGQKFPTISMPQSPDISAVFGVRGKQVFVNPYTGAIIGSRDPKTWLSDVHQLHLRLLMGPVGKTIVVCITYVLLFLVISGIYLWWSSKTFTIKWSANWMRIFFDAHLAVGIYSAAFLLLLGASGVVIHYDGEIEQWLLTSEGTTKIKKSAPSTPQPGATPITPDQAMDAAAAFMPGTKPFAVSLPPNPKGSYLVALRFPEDLTPGGRSWANVDQYSGKVVNSQNSRTVAGGTRTIILNRAIHTGDIFGTFSKIVMALSALLLVSQAITGYLLWWRKLRTKQRREDASELSETAA